VIDELCVLLAVLAAAKFSFNGNGNGSGL